MASLDSSLVTKDSNLVTKDADLEDLEESKYCGRATENYTEENPLGGIYLFSDETTASINSSLHANATTLKTAISDAKDFDGLKAAFSLIPKTELQLTIDYIGSPIIDSLYANLIVGVKHSDISDEPDIADRMQLLLTRTCVQTDNVQLIKFLISKGADLSADLDFAFLSACSGGNLRILKFLFMNGACVHEGFGQGLYYASGSGHLRVVKFLVANGANLSDDIYKSPLIGAAIGGHLPVVKFLVETGHMTEPNIHVACSNAINNGHLEVMKYLVTLDKRLGTKSPLMQKASGKGHLHIVKYIAENFNDVNLQYSINRSLYNAVRNGHLTIVNYLIDIGADTTVGSRTIFQSSLSDAILIKNKNQLEILKVLIERSIDKRASYSAAMAYAVSWNIQNIVDFLAVNINIPILAESIGVQSVDAQSNSINIPVDAVWF